MELIVEPLTGMADAPEIAALARVSTCFAVEARRRRPELQELLVEEESESSRHCQLNFEVVWFRWPSGLKHGLERGGCVPHRVGGPGDTCFYGERVWDKGILRSDRYWETNNWKSGHRSLLHEICDSAEYEHFPQALPLDNPMLSDFQLSTYGVLCLERCWDNEGQLTKLWVLNQEESDCDWTMTSLESTFGALYHFF
mmetsp:Transcript_13610/g.30077  ORF Transcript_13610/g.30077 Transcript_13610/m.30077 type:complete len:198 (+) Transcript_13610:29-622(+)